MSEPSYGIRGEIFIERDDVSLATAPKHVKELGDLLLAGGMDVQVGQFAIRCFPASHFVLRWEGNFRPESPWTFDVDSDNLSEIQTISRQLSAILTSHRIAHSIDVYERGGDELDHLGYSG